MASHLIDPSHQHGESSTSLSLLARACSQDHEAWRRMCALYGPLVYRWARRAGLQDSDAADIGQEVFRTLHQRLTAYDHQRVDATFRGWLHGITRNKIGDFQRRQNRQPAIATGGSTAQGALANVGDSANPGSTIPLLEELETESPFEESFVLRRMLHELQGEFESRTWKAFWLAVVEGRPHDEITEKLEMSPGAVRQAKYRVLRRIRLELGWGITLGHASKPPIE